MRAGRLRHPVTLLLPREADRTDTGEARYVDDSIGDTFVGVEAISGSRVEIASQLAPRATMLVTARYDPRIKAGMGLRMRDGDRVLNVEAVLDRTGRRRELELFCSEAVMA